MLDTTGLIGNIYDSQPDSLPCELVPGLDDDLSGMDLTGIDIRGQN